MQRYIRFRDSLVDRETKDFFIAILPNLENQFRQRKQYDEYWFYETHIDLDINILELINLKFTVTINEFEIIILN